MSLKLFDLDGKVAMVTGGTPGLGEGAGATIRARTDIEFAALQASEALLFDLP